MFIGKPQVALLCKTRGDFWEGGSHASDLVVLMGVSKTIL